MNLKDYFQGILRQYAEYLFGGVLAGAIAASGVFAGIHITAFKWFLFQVDVVVEYILLWSIAGTAIRDALELFFSWWNGFFELLAPFCDHQRVKACAGACVTFLLWVHTMCFVVTILLRLAVRIALAVLLRKIK